MTSKGSTLDTIHDIIKCTICLNSPKNPRFCPKCNALFCYECIQKWITTNPTCPACRSTLNTDNLSSNLIVSNILNELSKSQEYIQPDLCSIHNYDMIYYCNRCVESICSDCALFQHNGHSIEKISLIYNKHLEILKIEEEALKKRVEELNDLNIFLESDANQLLHNKKEVESEIEAEFTDMKDRLHKDVDQRFSIISKAQQKLNAEMLHLDGLYDQLYIHYKKSPSQFISTSASLTRSLQDIHKHSILEIYRPISTEVVSETSPPYEHRLMKLPNFLSGEQFVNRISFHGVVWEIRCGVEDDNLFINLKLLESVSDGKYFYKFTLINQNSNINKVYEPKLPLHIGKSFYIPNFLTKDSLIKEGYIVPENDVLLLEFGFKSPSFYSLCHDLKSYIKLLENQNYLLKKRNRDISTSFPLLDENNNNSSSNNNNNSISDNNDNFSRHHQYDPISQSMVIPNDEILSESINDDEDDEDDNSSSSGSSSSGSSGTSDSEDQLTSEEDYFGDDEDEEENDLDDEEELHRKPTFLHHHHHHYHQQSRNSISPPLLYSIYNRIDDQEDDEEDEDDEYDEIEEGDLEDDADSSLSMIVNSSGTDSESEEINLNASFNFNRYIFGSGHITGKGGTKKDRHSFLVSDNHRMMMVVENDDLARGILTSTESDTKQTDAEGDTINDKWLSHFKQSLHFGNQNGNSTMKEDSRILLVDQSHENTENETGFDDMDPIPEFTNNTSTTNQPTRNIKDSTEQDLTTTSDEEEEEEEQITEIECMVPTTTDDDHLEDQEDDDDEDDEIDQEEQENTFINEAFNPMMENSLIEVGVIQEINDDDDDDDEDEDEEEEEIESSNDSEISEEDDEEVQEGGHEEEGSGENESERVYIREDVIHNLINNNFDPNSSQEFISTNNDGGGLSNSSSSSSLTTMTITTTTSTTTNNNNNNNDTNNNTNNNNETSSPTSPPSFLV